MSTGSGTPSLLTLHMKTEVLNGYSNTPTKGTINIHARIPKQNIILKSVRIEYNSAANALADQVIYVDLPFLSSYCLFDGLQYQSLLPLVVDNAIVTILPHVDIHLGMCNPLNTQIQYRVVDRSGTAPANLVALTLQFELSVGAISG